MTTSRRAPFLPGHGRVPDSDPSTSRLLEPARSMHVSALFNECERRIASARRNERLSNSFWAMAELASANSPDEDENGQPLRSDLSR